MSEETVSPGWTRLVKKILFFLLFNTLLSVIVTKNILLSAIVLHKFLQL
jgi:hypothetical protein